MFGGNDTAFGGLGNDSIRHENGAAIGSPLLFGNEGNDTIDTRSAVSATVVGGNNSADGDDSIIDGVNTALIFGNGGNDTVDNGLGNDTAIGEFGNDCINDSGGTGNNLIFLNEGNDTYAAVGQDGTNTVFGGLGNNSIRTTSDALAGNRDSIQGNEGNDTIRGIDAIDTISGGSGNDVFAYNAAADDGNNAAGGGPVEFITDVDFSVDRFQTTPAITFATNTGAGTGVDLDDIRQQRDQQRERPGGRRLDGGGAIHLRQPYLSGDQPRQRRVPRHRRPAARHHRGDRLDRRQQLHLSRRGSCDRAPPGNRRRLLLLARCRRPYPVSRPASPAC